MHIATALAGFVRDDIEFVPRPGHITEETRAYMHALPTSQHCFYCDVPLTSRNDDRPTPKGTLTGSWRTLDHLVPRCRGGSGEASNLVAACSSCNKAKGDLDLEVFAVSAELAERQRLASRHRLVTAA